MVELEGIQPGQTVTLTIVKQPTNEAARKTLLRLLSKDPDAQREAERHRKLRRKHTGVKTRGGRTWYQRLVKQPATRVEVGRSGTLRATVDVLRDLPSVRRFVEVSPAS